MAAPTESRAYSVLAASISPARGGAWDVLVRTEAGALTLRFSAALSAGLLVLPRLPGFIAPKHDGRRHANALSPAKREKYLATYLTWKTSGVSQRVACEQHGTPHLPFQAWIYQHRAECEALLAAHRAPVPKPSGQIL